MLLKPVSVCRHALKPFVCVCMPSSHRPRPTDSCYAMVEKAVEGRGLASAAAAVKVLRLLGEGSSASIGLATSTRSFRPQQDLDETDKLSQLQASTSLARQLIRDYQRRQTLLSNCCSFSEHIVDVSLSGGCPGPGQEVLKRHCERLYPSQCDATGDQGGCMQNFGTREASH